MAVIELVDCTVTNNPQAGFNVYKIVTAATADAADTIDVSSLVSAESVVSARCQGAADGNLAIASFTTAGVLAIPGAATNEARSILIMGR